MSAPARPVRWWNSLRLRIAVALAVLSVSIVALVAVFIDQSVTSAGVERLRGQADERLVVAVTIWEINGRLTPDATREADEMPEEITEPLGERGSRSTWFDGRDAWAAQRLGADEVVAVRVDGAGLVAERASLRRALYVALGCALLAAVALGWLAAVGLSRRLRLAAVLAERRGATPVVVAEAVGGSDEVAALSAAIDEMAGRLESRLDSERRFGADVAHELRTPLTALVSAAELLPDSPEADLVRSQVGRMRALVVDLLDLFRAQGGHETPEMTRVDLATAVAQALSEVSPAHRDACRLQVTSSADAAVDRRRLGRVVANLAANAVTHAGASVARPAAFVISGRRLTVLDDGPGLPEGLLAAGPQPFARWGDRPGSGLGLALVSGQVAVMGAELSLTNAPDGGASVSIEFAPPPG